MAEVESLNGNLEQTIEAYNYANIELDRIESDLASNAKHLVAAKKSLVVAQDRIAERLRDLYVNGEGDSTLEVILGSSEPRRHHRAARRDRARLEPGHAHPPDGQAVPEGGRDAARAISRTRAPTRPRSSPSRPRRSSPSSPRSPSRTSSSPPSRTRSPRCGRRRRGGRPRSRRRRAHAPRPRSSPRWPAGRRSRRTTRSPGRARTTIRTSRAALRPRRRDRAAVPRRPVRLGRLEPVDGIRLLGLHELRLRAGRRVAAAPRGLAVRLRNAGVRTTSSHRATSSSSAASATSGSTSATASSSTRRTPATS